MNEAVRLGLDCHANSSIRPIMARKDLPRNHMADVTAALEEAHEAAVEAQSPTLRTPAFEQLAEQVIAHAHEAMQLTESALEAHRKNQPNS